MIFKKRKEFGETKVRVLELFDATLDFPGASQVLVNGMPGQLNATSQNVYEGTCTIEDAVCGLGLDFFRHADKHLKEHELIENSRVAFRTRIEVWSAEEKIPLFTHLLDSGVAKLP